VQAEEDSYACPVARGRARELTGSANGVEGRCKCVTRCTEARAWSGSEGRKNHTIQCRLNEALEAINILSADKEIQMEVNMNDKNQRCSASAAAVLMLVWLLVWPATSLAQLAASTVTGQGTVVQATVQGALGTTTTVLSDSGAIGAINQEQDASQDDGSIASLLTADVLSSSTDSYADEVDSEASLGDLSLTVGAVSITADSVLARASQVLGATSSGSSYIDNLAINGVPIVVTGVANQTVAIPGGQVVINEHTISQSGVTVVNALHVTVNGSADVVICAARVGIS
jgi:hypothetical protein